MYFYLWKTQATKGPHKHIQSSSPQMFALSDTEECLYLNEFYKHTLGAPLGRS